MSMYNLCSRKKIFNEVMLQQSFLFFISTPTYAGAAQIFARLKYELQVSGLASVTAHGVAELQIKSIDITAHPGARNGILYAFIHGSGGLFVFSAYLRISAGAQRRNLFAAQTHGNQVGKVVKTAVSRFESQGKQVFHRHRAPTAHTKNLSMRSDIIIYWVFAQNM